MKTRITLLTAERHKITHVRQDLGYPHTHKLTYSTVVAAELTELLADYVVAFMKNSETGAFLMVALLGLEPGCNAYQNAHGWNATYVPLNIRRHPFSLGVGDGETMAICIDEASPVLTTDTAATALFDGKGLETPYLISQRKALATLRDGQEEVQDFIRALLNEGLIVPFEYIVTYQNGREQKIEGLYTVDLQGLDVLTADALQRLNVAGHLSNAYKVALSRTHISRLVQLHNAQYAPAIASVQIERR